MLNYFMLLSAFCTLRIDAFWWPATTTEAPTTTTTTVLKEIPLTYFRTYTYQPLAGNPFTFPFSFGFGASQTPLLSSARYDPYVSSYPPATYAGSTNDIPIPILNMAQIIRPASVISSSGSASKSTTSTTTPRPPPPPPTTTTTTTTSTTTTTTPPPPPPPPTTTTTSTTTSRPLTPPSRGLAVESPLSDYSNFNRRVYQVSNDGFSGSYFTRPQYPYPDYFNYHQPHQLRSQQQQPQSQPQHQQQQNLLFQNPSPLSPKSNSRIQFVPCMCPVSVSLTTSGVGSYDTRSASIVGSPIIALSEGTVQARTDDEDDDIDDEIDELSDVVRQHFAEPISNTAASITSNQVPYPASSAYVNPTATTLSSSSSLSSTKSGLSSLSPSSLSKIIIEAMPTIPSPSSILTSTQVSSTHDPKEFINEQVAPEDIIVFTAETEEDNDSTLPL